MKKLIFCLSFLLPSALLISQDNDEVIKEMVVQSRQLRELIQSDPHRPVYHFAAPEGHAMPFDPNGAIFWKGKYHLGYIYQYLRNGKSEHFWGHAVSTDLLHWSLYPDMLSVKEGDIEKGIFSGGAFLSREGIPHIMYHGQGSSTNLVAYSTDEKLRVWNKFEGNPVLRTPGENDLMYGKYRAWDPEGWYDKEADCYYQISGGPVAGFFKSKDMYDWEYLGNFIDQNKKERYDFEDLSCPDFFNIGDKKMLLFISHNLGTQYYIGTFENDKYTVEKHGRMNWPGGTFFAPEQLVDDRERNIIWGWILERKPEHLENFGWSGIMSIPRVLTLSDDGKLQIDPPEEIGLIRIEKLERENVKLLVGREEKLDVKGKALEIKIEINGGIKSPCGVKVFCSPDGREETTIKYEPETGELVVDFIKSSVSNPVEMSSTCMGKPMLEEFGDRVSEQRAPFELKKGESLKLDIFIDHSVIEVFANSRQCITQVVYPELENSDNIKIFCGDENILVRHVNVWEMAETNLY